MNNLTNEEKSIKRYLKRKMTITLATTVKYLICGLLTLSISACGGGGGGSETGSNIHIVDSSSGASVENHTISENNNEKNSSSNINNPSNTDNKDKSKKVEEQKTGNITGTTVEQNNNQKPQENKNNSEKNKIKEKIKNRESVTIRSKNPIGLIALDKDIENYENISIDTNSQDKSDYNNQSEEMKNIFKEIAGAGIYVEKGIGKNTAQGKIKINGDNVAGMAGIDATLINDGDISSGDNLQTGIGMYSKRGDIVNNGEIELISNSDAVGIKSDNSNNKDKIGIENNKNIYLNSLNAKGIATKGDNIDIKNGPEGNITLDLNPVEDEITPIPTIKSAGIYSEGNNLDVENSGNIVLNNNVNQCISSNYEVAGIGVIGDNNTIINKEKIEINSPETDTENKIGVIGIKFVGDNQTINNKGNIILEKKEGIGIKGISNSSKIENSGNITVNGKNISGIRIVGNNINVINKGNISVMNIVGYSDRYKVTGGVTEPYSAGIFLKGDNTSIENNGTIIFKSLIKQPEVEDLDEDMVISSSFPNNYTAIVLGTGDNGSITNRESIDIQPSETKYSTEYTLTYGMYGGKNVKISNYGNIKSDASETIAMSSIGNGELKNYGNIELGEKSLKSIGIYVSSGTGVNEENGKIIINSQNYPEGYTGFDGVWDVGEFIEKDDVEYINIDPESFPSASIGIYAMGSGNIGINNGTIEVKGTNNIGMLAENGGKVINGKKGVISISNFNIAMKAVGENSTIENRGVINIEIKTEDDFVLGETDNTYGLYTGNGQITNSGTINIRIEKDETKDADELFSDLAMSSLSGNITNSGVIKVNGRTLEIAGDNIQVAPNSTLSAKEIKVNGSVTVLADDAKAGYAEEYSAENVIKGDKVEVGENANIKSNSLMYTAVPVVTNKTLGARLVRTGVADKLDSRFTDVGKALDRAYADAGKLDKSQKAVADKIFDHSGNRADLNNAVAKASGKEYVAVARQVFDIKDSFRKYDSTVINTLGDNDFNATVIGDYSKVDTKDSIANYKDTMTGFDAVAKLPHNMYGVAGYGFSNIDYKDSSSKEKIHTLHAALYKDFVKENNKLTLGVFGDYNFHRMNRESLDSNVKTNFHSYLVGVSGEFAKHYGDKFYVEPMVGLDITYGNINRVSEDSVLEVSKHDYTSVLPKVGVTFGERFDMADLYVKAQYSKDLGNMDKDLKVKLLNQDATIENENLKAGQFDVSVGVKSEINSVTLSADVGRRFGKTHTTYVKAGIGYRF
ncbi:MULTISPECIES: autotransporter domain-containing protein [unclassified Fusobacterium]|uniref:autotransporter family protein n=1 Tax=unclassified Fusobacterium TaxID=2648384 RepID=UPI001B8CD82A|nr:MULTISPECIES: autotransporter domain-containing protein [unclassified Fusobacterium]MBR8701702.1 hypothetical protein [Fusobacterium sp. DD45]MBR8711480.1 hypothetical protein [Fusobacterium sp. DD28]MBR8752032.1 hypothetical protein [Fusobacterium sp. DD26]